MQLQVRKSRKTLHWTKVLIPLVFQPVLFIKTKIFQTLWSCLCLASCQWLPVMGMPSIQFTPYTFVCPDELIWNASWNWQVILFVTHVWYLSFHGNSIRAKVDTLFYLRHYHPYLLLSQRFVSKQYGRHLLWIWLNRRKVWASGHGAFRIDSAEVDIHCISEHWCYSKFLFQRSKGRSATVWSLIFLVLYMTNMHFRSSVLEELGVEPSICNVVANVI